MIEETDLVRTYVEECPPLPGFNLHVVHYAMASDVVEAIFKRDDGDERLMFQIPGHSARAMRTRPDLLKRIVGLRVEETRIWGEQMGWIASE